MCFQHFDSFQGICHVKKPVTVQFDSKKACENLKSTNADVSIVRFLFVLISLFGFRKQNLNTGNIFNNSKQSRIIL
jgi:hypothetical protein